MNDQFSMFDPKTSEASPSATSSQGSEAGPTPSDSPDGPTTDQSGPDHVPVSRFRARASKKAMTTNDTSGPLFTNSSPSADLQRSMENRLRANLEGSGSPEYALTWKMHDMPSGPPICALRASGRRTSGKGSSGWPTPMAGTPAQNGNNAAGNNDSSRKTVALVSGWPTPNARENAGGEYSDPEKAIARYMDPRRNNDLTEAAHLVTGWPTPTKIDNVQIAGQGAAADHPKRGTTLGGAASLSPAPTANHDESQPTKPGSLNPAFSLWLMGYPIEWAHCAERVTRSSRKSPRPS